jgi:hypothetical protein
MAFIDAHVHVWTPDTAHYPLAAGYQKENMQPASFTPEELFKHTKPAGVPSQVRRKSSDGDRKRLEITPRLHRLLHLRESACPAGRGLPGVRGVRRGSEGKPKRNR